MKRTEKEETIFGNIMILANKLNQLGDLIFPDISCKQWFLLLIISKMDAEEKSLNGIAEMAGSTRQNIKKMLVPLEKKGYVVISKSQHDLRSLSINLTKKTFDYFNNITEVTTQEINTLFALFSNDELDSYIRNVEKLQSSIEIYRERRRSNEK